MYEFAAETTFTVDESGEGSCEVTFTFSGGNLAGRMAVAFETLSYDGNAIASHTDLCDSAQAVHIPGEKTEASEGQRIHR